MKVWVNRNYDIHYVEFINGEKVVAPLKVIGNKEHRITITYYPDFNIMEKIEYDDARIINRMKQLTFLNKGVELDYQNEKTDQKQEWLYSGGVNEYIVELNKDNNH